MIEKTLINFFFKVQNIVEHYKIKETKAQEI